MLNKMQELQAPVFTLKTFPYTAFCLARAFLLPLSGILHFWLCRKRSIFWNAGETGKSYV